MPAPKVLLVLSILWLLPSPMAAGISSQGASAGADVGFGETALYLADGAKLTTTPGGEGSAPFPPQAKLSIGLVWLVGTWDSEPLAAPMNYAGNINFSIWAKASSAAQLSTRFQVYFGTNGARGPTAYTTNSDRLGTTPTELKGTASGVNLKAGIGDTLTFMVYVSERGSGGDIVYGSTYPSGFKLNLRTVTLNLTYNSKPGALDITGNITDIWGSQDIDTVYVGILRFPAESVNQTENLTGIVKVVTLDSTDLETEGNETVFSYTWKYDATGIKAGTYYVVVMVVTYSNSVAANGFSLQLNPISPGGIPASAVMAAGAVIAVAAVVGAAYYLKKSGRGFRLRPQAARNP